MDPKKYCAQMEQQIVIQKSRIAALTELNKSQHTQLTAAQAELYRYRRAGIIKRVWRWIVGFYPKSLL